MNYKRIHRILNYLLALVWLINGLFCKALGLAPRHELIVARILGRDYARPLTMLIGIAETIMALWILSGMWKRLNAIVQVLVIAAMNIVERILAPDLLLWGKANAFFAFLLILVICYNSFILAGKADRLK